MSRSNRLISYEWVGGHRNGELATIGKWKFKGLSIFSPLSDVHTSGSGIPDKHHRFFMLYGCTLPCCTSPPFPILTRPSGICTYVSRKARKLSFFLRLGLTFYIEIHAKFFFLFFMCIYCPHGKQYNWRV